MRWLAGLVSLALLAETQPVQFVDITRQAGIQFTHNNGATGKKYLPETLGSGVAFLDFNNDGLQDALLINGKGSSKLYRNNGNSAFTDVTANSGLDVPLSGMGVAAADCDNDGNIDVYITSAEHYPDDAEHIRYWLEYNTRHVASPAPAHPQYRRQEH